MRTNAENFVKILQTSRPWGTNFLPKFEILTVLGTVFPHFFPDKRQIWHGGAKFHVYRGNVSGRRTHFGPLSKNNTGMAAQRAGLPVKKLSGNFGYMGRSNPWGDLDQMWHVGRYGGRNHVCNISWLSVKGCGCGERGKFAFSHWLDMSPLQHWSHCHVTVWLFCICAF